MVRSALAVRRFSVLRRGPVRMVRGPQTCPEPHLRGPRGPLISETFVFTYMCWGLGVARFFYQVLLGSVRIE